MMSQGSLFISLLLSAIAYYKIDRPEPVIPDIKPDLELLPEYDFIIVGGGSAGAVIASRLSEISSWNVLLLEVGGAETDLSDIPYFAPALQHSDLDWKYQTEPQETSCLALEEGRCNWPRGKVLGGSSVLNYMLYLRGNKNDYDIWESLGNKGWGYKDVLKYFLKSEDNQDSSLLNTPYHSAGGYLTVSEPPYRSPLVASLIEAGLEMGYSNIDLNGENQTGIMALQGTMRDGRRCSTVKAFLQPAKDRKNLHISLHSFVTKILIDPNTKAAFGVEFIKNEKKYRVRARKEVILSAGTINSAQLLLLSGIGPSEDLAKHNIPLIQNLQVGKNLQDHISPGGLTFVINKPITLDESTVYTFSTLMEYAVMRKGPLTAMGALECAAFVSTKYANSTDNHPDIELLFMSKHLDGSTLAQKIHGITDALYNAVFEPISRKDAWVVAVMLMRPKSRGYLQLKSANPYDYPNIYSNYLTDERDVKTIVEGIKIAFDLSKTNALQLIGSEFNQNIFPACINFEKHSDEFYECMIRQYTFTIYHQVGTAKMGPHWDPDAVVDHELKVYGIKGLRVIDGSIMPNIISGHTNAPIIMIAEKGSDMIKDSWMK